MHRLPGPKSSSWIYGNGGDVWKAESSVLQEKWIKEHGPTIVVTGPVGLKGLYTTDTKAVNHILMNTDVYQKPTAIRYGLTLFMGPGLVAVEGDKHRLQRKIMAPAFASSL
ncbi:putative cytochrome P450 [Lyophyllum shimeji]|uniref:Cytochrome P450 n=1 Tax=Lyophyllum shimeji TaxID=47721 RepID=A0A9P3PVY5_LYOSH|nr:putative cytochrome P450 [Lyophyllum shimeji]